MSSICYIHGASCGGAEASCSYLASRARGLRYVWRAACALLPIVLLLLSPIPRASGQVVFQAVGVNVGVGRDGEDSKPKYLFNFPTQTNEVRESLEDFQRFIGRAAWEKAFQSLDTVRKAPAGKLIAGNDRFALPIEFRLRQTLVEMPPAGREAYRLFYDAAAKKLLDEATGDKELANLQQIVSGYFTTSVGDVAADRLGDLHFQRGEMQAAGDCWQMILRYLPDSQIPRPILLVKTAIALSRQGRWAEFREIEKSVAERYAREKVILGGKEVEAAAHLAELASKAPTTVASTDLPNDIPLSDDAAPLWQFRFLTAAAGKSLNQIGRNWGWGRMPISEMVPAATVDGSRLYLNFVGYHAAVDLTNGKLVWRSGKFHDIAQQLQDKYYLFPEQFALVPGDGWLASVFKDPKNLGNHGQPFWLGRFDAASGKPGWSSDSVGALKAYSICGSPLIVGDRIYVTANKTDNQTELHLLAVGATDGRVIWTTHLGTSQVDQSQMYYRRTAQPAILHYGDALFIDTQGGGLAAVGMDKGELRWGFNYEAEAPSQEYWNNPNLGLETSGAPVLHNGVLYVKGMRSTRLCAVDLAAAKLVWERPVSKSAVALSIDGQHMLLGGDELTALDLNNQRLVWATRLPLATGWTRPAVTKNRIYQFTPRGIFVLDKQNGDRLALARGADLESLGGMVILTQHGLLTVSNLAVTCYPLSPTTSTAQASAAPVGQTAPE